MMQHMKMKNLHSITEFLDSYLAISEIEETFFNGLQVEGRQEIKTITFAVDASLHTFEKTIEHGADMLIVHHGHFSSFTSPVLVGWKKKRIELLLTHSISLYCAHLPLDRHKDVSNNAQLLKLLSADIEKEFALYEGKNIGWIGKIKQPTTIKEIEKTLKAKLNATCITLPFGPKIINTIAVCSGGGGYKLFSQALKAGADLYLTGDAIEIYSTAQDAGMNIIFAGHYATETIGLKALAEVVQKQFDVKVILIDAPTGL